MKRCECDKILRGTATVSSGDLLITLPSVSELVNGDIIHFVICSNIDYSNPLGLVAIEMNGAKFLLRTRFNNELRVQQLRPRKVYTVGLGAEEPSFTMLTNIPESSFVFSTYIAPVAAKSKKKERKEEDE